MNKMIVKGESPFQVPGRAFAISPSLEGYTLNYSVDGVDWTAYEEATASGVTELVNCPVEGMFFKLAGNFTDVTIRY